MKYIKLKLIIGLSFALALVFFALAATAQTRPDEVNPFGGVYYADMVNPRMYGRLVIPRSETSNLDTLTHLIDGTFVFDSLQNRLEYVDTNGVWVGITSGGNSLDEAYDKGGAGLGREITADNGAVKISGTDGLLVTGTFGSGAAAEISGAGTRMFFNPAKAAFRAGSVSGTQWNDANIAEYSVAFGEDNIASGQHSVALGTESTASGDVSFAFGTTVLTSGGNSISVGEGTIASGDASVAMGNSANASGVASVAMGRGAAASGDISTSLGEATTAESYAETAIGVYNTNYTPTSTTEWEATDRLFVIGNGQSSGTRSDALVMLKDGSTTLNGSLAIVDGTEGENYVLTSDASGNATWTHTFSYGEMGFGDSTATIALTQNTPAWVTNGNNNLWSEGATTLEGTTYSNDSLICNADGIYEINLRISGDLALNDVLKVGVYKNGSLSCTCQGQITSPLAGTVEITYIDILSLSADDALQVYITNTANNNDFDAISAKITMHKVGQ